LLEQQRWQPDAEERIGSRRRPSCFRFYRRLPHNLGFTLIAACGESVPRTVQRHNPRIFIRQACSAWRDVGGFADGDRDRERSPPAINMAQ